MNEKWVESLASGETNAESFASVPPTRGCGARLTPGRFTALR